MKNFKEWFKENYKEEMPNGDIRGDWFHKHSIPMIVSCSCCESTMCVISAIIDDKGNIYCSSCVDI